VGTQHDSCLPSRSCCEQILSPLGEERALGLAEWFDSQGITRTLDNVIATFKPRTVASVRRIALDAGLQVVPLPVNQTLECDPAHDAVGANKNDNTNDATSSMQPMYDYIAALPQGSTTLVASHSTTIYQIMSRLGIDVLASPTTFPLELTGGATTCDPWTIDKKNPDPNKRGCKVLGFNNLWKVEIDHNGTASVTDHWVLDVSLVAKSHDHVGLGCNKVNDHDDGD
jgi:hypothetical protein